MRSGSENAEYPVSAEKKELNSKLSEIIAADPWEEIGIHRNIGAFWYNFSLTILTLLISLSFLSLLARYLYPYPEMKGYLKVADGFFAIVYQLFDMGTAFGIELFISKYRVQEPKRMIKYIQWFIWYQMMTGLIQVTVISIFVYKVILTNNLAYLGWLFLIICQKQYPGMLGTFKNSLIGLQKYNKSNLLSFLGSEVIKNILTVVFVLAGRAWGQANPQYGDLFGATIGLAIGGYFMDFVVMGLSAHYFNQAIRPFGYSFRDAWRIEFDWTVVKESLWFGAQTSIVPIINTVTSTWMLLLYVEALPQYTTWVFIAEIASGIGGAINVGDFGMTPPISEAYSNGKKKLSLYYVQTALKWNGFFMMLLICIIGGFAPMILSRLTQIPDLAPYANAVGFIPFFLIAAVFRPFIDIPNSILMGTLHIGFYTFARITEEIFQVFFVWFFLYGIRIHETLGMLGIFIIFGWEHFFPRLIKMAICFIYINRNIFQVKINWMPSFVIPLIAASPVIIIALVWQFWVFDVLIAALGIYLAAAITLVIAVIPIPLLIFLPLTGILGGWDTNQLKIFKKSTDLSGPSKFIVFPFYKMVSFWAAKSKYTNQWRIPWEDAEREIDELHLIKASQTYVKPQKQVQGVEFVNWVKKGIKSKK